MFPVDPGPGWIALTWQMGYSGMKTTLMTKIMEIVLYRFWCTIQKIHADMRVEQEY